MVPEGTDWLTEGSSHSVFCRTCGWWLSLTKSWVISPDHPFKPPRCKTEFLDWLTMLPEPGTHGGSKRIREYNSTKEHGWHYWIGQSATSMEPRSPCCSFCWKEGSTRHIIAHRLAVGTTVMTGEPQAWRAGSCVAAWSSGRSCSQKFFLATRAPWLWTCEMSISDDPVFMMCQKSETLNQINN